MQIEFWGVRGSLANGCATSARYGCNTSCYSMETQAGSHIIFDAGSGIRNLGAYLQEKNKPKKCRIIISHGHWDHVAGLPFFDPLYSLEWDIEFYMPENIGGVGPHAFMDSLFCAAFFPVEWHLLAKSRPIHSLSEGQTLEFDGVFIDVFSSNHGTYAERGIGKGIHAVGVLFRDGQHTIFHSGDHELGSDTSLIDTSTPFYQHLRGADIAILDAQYTLESYNNGRVGWGHSALEQWVPFIFDLDVKVFVPTHYDPAYDDAFLDKLCTHLVRTTPHLDGRMRMAHEGLVMQAGNAINFKNTCAPINLECENCRFSSELLDIPDMSSVLDNLLHRARRLCSADAGTIYLVEDNELVFSYSHNDTLFTSSQSARQQYLNARLPITPQSIAGYVASQSTILNIPDVRNIPTEAPYSFNDSFDRATGYNTVSICALPIVTHGNKLLAVMQIINSMHKGSPVPFSTHMECVLRELSFVGAQAIEQALSTRDMLLRVLETSRLRDPTETGPHVFRVGAMAAELYHHWAEKKGIDIVEIADTKAHLRLASMLHDVGKVGISDQVLKKPGAFTPEERKIMEKHCVIGAAIFKNPSRTLDKFASNIAMHHHQKWDGTGYCGAEDTGVVPLAGEDIPFEARITSIVDVFDALISPRCYKDPMPVEKALSILRKDSGTFFDPEMIESFMELIDTMLAIQAKYQEEPVQMA